MQTQRLRVGIAGAGQAGERHAAGFAAAGADVVAIADVAADRAASVGARFGAAALSDWRSLRDLGLDLIVVALPHHMHVEPAEAAAAEGIHVLMEKPIAVTIADGTRIIEACRRANVKLTIGFVHRYREEVEAASRWLQQGEIGQPLIVRETFGSQNSARLPRWVFTKKMAGGGVLMYGAIHSIDRLRWLLASDVESVVALTRDYAPGLEVEDGVAALLTFANGAAITLSASAPMYRAQPAHWETEIYGEHGLVRVRTGHWATLSSDNRKERVKAPSEVGAMRHYNFARQAKSFLTAITEDQEPFVTGYDGLKALEVVLAIYRSAETGNRVILKAGSPER